MAEIKKHYIVEIKKEQLKDFGIIVTMVFIISGIRFDTSMFFILALAIALFTILFPSVFYPFTLVWFKFSKILGKINSQIILAIIFFLVITPVGVFRRILGKDTLRLKDFKKGTDSVMKQRNHAYTPSDLEHLF
ncbi:hypothetical protein HPE56_08590 [Maribacter sp. ANRC-HE7]|uniref:AI-2E family transporter n=1 Tax=Maribacter aquimaris TaxID=2737171 RepID=A0ABR7UZ26_9FLAO|nr:SxtJ family membrane protein [Maribacter aquimaris]MBD0777849.1 hypothetical protein [Maribacter aquimaris]